jgi:hypothetical protein
MDAQKKLKKVGEQVDKGVHYFFYYGYLPVLLAVGRQV